MNGEWVRWTSRQRRPDGNGHWGRSLWHRERTKWPGLTCCGKPFGNETKTIERADAAPSDRQSVCLICEGMPRR